jgi:hypothetical protein
VGPLVPRQEALPDGVLGRLRQVDPERRAGLQEEGVRELAQQPRTVAGLLLGAAGSPVVQAQEDPGALADDLVRPDVLEVGDEADAARVVLEAGVPPSSGLPWPSRRCRDSASTAGEWIFVLAG